MEVAEATPSILNENMSDITSEYEIKADYPQIEGEEDFNLAVMKYIEDTVADYRELFIEAPDVEIPYPSTLNISYQAYTPFSDVVIVLFTEDFFTMGAAHPNIEFHTIHFDLLNDKAIQMTDFFSPESGYLNFISRCIEILTSNLIRDQVHNSDSLMNESEYEWILQGAGPNEENLENYVFDDEGMKIFFEPYQVTNYASGSQEVKIAYSDLETILIDRFAEEIAASEDSN